MSAGRVRSESGSRATWTAAPTFLRTSPVRRRRRRGTRTRAVYGRLSVHTSRSSSSETSLHHTLSKKPARNDLTRWFRNLRLGRHGHDALHRGLPRVKRRTNFYVLRTRPQPPYAYRESTRVTRTSLSLSLSLGLVWRDEGVPSLSLSLSLSRRRLSREGPRAFEYFVPS